MQRKRRRLTGEDWQQQQDQRTGLYYWLNIDTGEYSWDRPVVIVQLEAEHLRAKIAALERAAAATSRPNAADTAPAPIAPAARGADTKPADTPAADPAPTAVPTIVAATRSHRPLRSMHGFLAGASDESLGPKSVDAVASTPAPVEVEADTAPGARTASHSAAHSRPNAPLATTASAKSALMGGEILAIE